ncbi:hypothetical protein [Brevibacillus laterosporus]|uniref:hypothetical protein n=1 Tax=Brevibacillus laterosporus TaxID=1465 RepID=UPI002651C238|nr:hypothetical protein [Brevibacillus laterosporus]MDN9012468.1 hypothetical protein [Brevibacillus laterosporus]MDO0943565.1 hypothetical protein [Brevibacillus laterosporus]
MTDKEWIEAVTNLWVMQEAGMLDFKKDISEIELYTNRMDEVVINMIQRSFFEKEEMHRKAEEWKGSKNLMIEECHQAECERNIEKKDVEKERELLHLRTDFQDKLQKTNEESIAKIQALYERIE